MAIYIPKIVQLDETVAEKMEFMWKSRKRVPGGHV